MGSKSKNRKAIALQKYIIKKVDFEKNGCKVLLMKNFDFIINQLYANRQEIKMFFLVFVYGWFF